MRRFLREQGLSLFFFAIFVATLIGQSFAGQHAFNSDQVEHGQAPVSWWEHLTSPEFVGAVMENWQSEFLQFSLFIGVTVWLIQRGSNESKKPEDAGLEDEEKQQIGRHASERAPGWATPNDIRTRLYENSLLIVMTLIFFATWLAQSLNNWRQFNAEHATHDERAVSWPRLPSRPGLLGTIAAELAVGVPGGRHHGRLHDLSTPTRIARVEARRGTPRRDRIIGLIATDSTFGQFEGPRCR